MSGIFVSVRNFFSGRIGCKEYLGCGEHFVFGVRTFFLVSEIFFWCPKFLGGRNFWVVGIFEISGCVRVCSCCVGSS